MYRLPTLLFRTSLPGTSVTRWVPQSGRRGRTRTTPSLRVEGGDTGFILDSSADRPLSLETVEGRPRSPFFQSY